MAIAVAVLAAAVLAPAVANAVSPSQSATDGRSAAVVAVEVLYAADQGSAFAALGPRDRATFLAALKDQTLVTVKSEFGPYTPTAAERAAMSTSAPPSEISGIAVPAASGCWYYYFYKEWYDLGFIHDGDSWMQLNWCGNGTSVTSWSQTNVGCAGHLGFSCVPGDKSELNVGWEVRSARYFNATWGPFHNSICQLILEPWIDRLSDLEFQ